MKKIRLTTFIVLTGILASCMQRTDIKVVKVTLKAGVGLRKDVGTAD
ncbi:hypothetical protein [Mucilaginibacter terrenus]|nr:hypothetical protein [Mucilaginibacter terrenus]